MVPSLENARPLGASSWAKIEVLSTKTAVDTSKDVEGFLRVPDVSCTAPGSIVSSGTASSATVARRDAFNANDIVAPSVPAVASLA